MVRISKSEAIWLISQGYIKSERGRFINYTITGRHKKSSQKQRFVPEEIADKLKMLVKIY